MITEIALFTAVPGKEEALEAGIREGMPFILQHPGCLSSHLERCIEKPEQYLLTNTWTSLEAHMVDFRGGPLFPQWRSHINGLFISPASVFHYQGVEKE